jgi:DNA-directed RNA polymerase subunit alpha
MRDENSSTTTYGRFVVEPFERGFGTTVGNSLRRILLSSLEGAAVSKIKIPSVAHEFTSIQGVMEDVTDIILNVKSLIIKTVVDGQRVMRVSAKKVGEVRASDIDAEAGIEILNTDQVLATLTDNIDFSLEMTVDRGRGYRTATENADEADELGIITIDSLFSPVTRVRYKTEETRVGQRTNYDRLIVEIWTNGTVLPEDALVEAAKILRKHLNPFVQYNLVGSATGVGNPLSGVRAAGGLDEGTQAKLRMSIQDLELSVRANNCLESNHIQTVGDLLKMSEAQLLKIRSFGKTSLREVKRKISNLGLEWPGAHGADSKRASGEVDSPAIAN